MTDLLETWPNVEVRSVIRIFSCEVCQTMEIHLQLLEVYEVQVMSGSQA